MMVRRPSGGLHSSFGMPGAPKRTVESAISAPNKADMMGLTQVEAVSKTADGGANPSRPAIDDAIAKLREIVMMEEEQYVIITRSGHYPPEEEDA